MTDTLIESFLELYQSERLKKEYRHAINKFFEWLGKSPKDVNEEYKDAEDKNQYLKQYGIIVSKYYNYHVGRGVKVNTALGYVTPVRAWFRVNCDRLREVKIDKPQMAVGEHEFKLSQLQQMYRTADSREKAILTLGVCLGYGASMFAGLKREQLKQIIAQRDSEEPPIGFWIIRGKTKQPIRSHLTVEAMEALEDYWKIAPESKWAFPSNNGSKHISRESLNYTLKSLTEKAKIPVMGQIRWHLLRKFLFSALTNVSSEMNAKLMVGKSIPIDVLTYLKNKTEQLKTEFAEAEKFFVLGGMTNHNHSKMAELEAKVEMQDEQFQKMMGLFVEYLEEKISKKKAVEKAKKITDTYTSYGKILTEKEVYEEKVGYNLTEEQFQQIKTAEQELQRELTAGEIDALLKQKQDS